MNFGDILSGLQNSLAQYFQPKLVSPVPAPSSLVGQPGLLNYYAAQQNNDLGAKNASSYIPPTNQNQNVNNYPPLPALDNQINGIPDWQTPIGQSSQPNQQVLAAHIHSAIPQSSFASMALPIFQQYGIPPQVGMGMWGAEGRNSGLGASRNNFFNLSAFDSNPNAATAYPTPQAGIEAFAKQITGQGNYPSPKTQQLFLNAYNQYKQTQDPYTFMEGIQNAGYAGDPSTFQSRSQGHWPSYSYFTEHTPEWSQYSQ